MFDDEYNILQLAKTLPVKVGDKVTRLKTDFFFSSVHVTFYSPGFWFVALFLVLPAYFFCRTSKVKNKGPKDIMAVEDMNGEVRFSTRLPYPNNLSR